MIRSGAEIEILGVDIFSRLWDEKVDLTEVEKLIDKKFDLKREGLKKLIRTFVTVKNLLTRDQLKRLKIIRKADKASEESGSHSCR
ncbi:MAG: hypothetical protein NT033_04535 [Candidatus Omnitrophica bacterium]|nr:hypothetical protein [Candidatus Omnitrophota bacterium]